MLIILLLINLFYSKPYFMLTKKKKIFPNFKEKLKKFLKNKKYWIENIKYLLREKNSLKIIKNNNSTNNRWELNLIY